MQSQLHLLNLPACYQQVQYLSPGPTGAGIEYSINGTVWQATTTFSGVAAGGYTVRARYTADPTCESTQAVTITAALGSPGAITTTLTQPTCLVPTGTIAVTAPLGAGIEYSINGTIWQTTTTFSGVAAGGYTVRARYTADPTCESTQAVTITAALGSPGAIATTLTQPTCLVPTGTILITGHLLALALNTASTVPVWQTTTTFSGVAAGGYTVRARYTADPTCESTLGVTINPKPDCVPVALNDSFVATEDTPFAGTVTANDTPSDDGGNTWSLFSQASHGTAVVNTNGSFTYSSEANFNGADSFVYQLCDSDGDCVQATVAITINAVNDPPVNNIPPAQTVNEDQNLIFSSANGNLITISDIDIAETVNGRFLVRLTATNGQLTLSQTTGLIFISGDGLV